MIGLARVFPKTNLVCRPFRFASSSTTSSSCASSKFFSSSTKQQSLFRRFFRKRVSPSSVVSPRSTNSNPGSLLLRLSGIAGGSALLYQCCAISGNEKHEADDKAKGGSLMIPRASERSWFDLMYERANGYVTKTTPAVCGIVAVNMIIFACWRVPSLRLQEVMNKHFTNSAHGTFVRHRYHTLITSVFSHESGLHFLFNNFALVSISPVVCYILGTAKFMMFYLTGGIFSSLCSVGFQSLRAGLVTRVATNLARGTGTAIRKQPGLGASGALFGIFAIRSLLFPEDEFILIFLPMFPIKAETMLPALACLDVLGLIYCFFGNSPLGHAAHLGGVIAGVLYTNLYLRNYHPTVKQLHDRGITRSTYRPRDRR